MKTKLLRKFRKRYTLDYYPNGFTDYEGDYNESRAVVARKRNWLGIIKNEDYEIVMSLDSPATKHKIDDLMEIMLDDLRHDYIEYTRKYKINQQNRNKKIRLWYAS